MLAEFVKNIEKWDIDEIIQDLDTYNQKFRQPVGLKPLDLEYFKRWDINEELKRINY